MWSLRYIDAPILRNKNTDTNWLCDNETIYYLGSANFNITTLVNSGGNAVERYVYSPYGVLTIDNPDWSDTQLPTIYATAYTYTGTRCRNRRVLLSASNVSRTAGEVRQQGSG